MSDWRLRATSSILSIIVMAQAGRQLHKYFEGKTTVARSTEHHDRLLLPSLSVCPGFKQGQLQDKKWLEVVYGRFRGHEALQLPKTVEEMDADWDELTFSWDELVASLALFAGDFYYYTNEDNTDFRDAIPEHVLSIDTHSTLFGKCFTLTAKAPVTKAENIYFRLNMTKFSDGDKVAVFFHEPWAYIGLNDNFWPASSSVEYLMAGVQTDVALTKTVAVYATTDATKDSFHNCLQQEITDAIKVLKKSDDLCYCPGMQSLLLMDQLGGGIQLEPCSSMTDLFKSMNQMNNILIATLETNCSKPHRKDFMSLARRDKIKFTYKDIATISVYYESTDVTVETEYVLLDPAALLAAIGGIIGICLGWSLNDLAKLIFNYV